jgi:hypothetical protein
MIIKGTPRIRGMLDLPNIKKQIGRNDSIPVSDVEFWSSDVQIALKMGYLTAVGNVERYPDAKGEVERVIKLVNRHKSPLNIPSQTNAIPPGAQFTLRESELQNADIRTAISRGIIGVVNTVDVDNASEGFVKLGKNKPAVPQKSAVPEAPQAPEAPQPPEEVVQNLSSAQRALLEAARKSQEAKQKAQKVLDTNEEISTAPKVIEDKPATAAVEPANVINTENPAPIQPKDALGKSVVFNPTGDKPLRIMKNASVVKQKKEGITFVDKEQQEERVQSHPTLKPQKEEEFELLDLEDVGRKRNPNLPPQTETNEVEPVE